MNIEEFYGIKYLIHYDPLEEVFFCGIPGFVIPTIYVGKIEEEVREAVRDKILDYIDFCADQGSCRELEIKYDAQEAYSSGWIIREEGSIVSLEKQSSNFDKQKSAAKDKTEINGINNSIDLNNQYDIDLVDLLNEIDDINESKANLYADLQIARSKLINLAKATNHKRVRGYGVEVLKVERLGLQKENNGNEENDG